MNIKTNPQEDFNSDQPVGIDYFLYSCFEFESTCKALPRTIVGDDRWPVMLGLLEGERGEFDDLTISELAEKMADWYAEKFPYLTAANPVNFRTLAEVVPATVMMAKDLDMIIKEKTGSSIPTFKTANKSDVWQLIEKTLEKKLTKHAYFFSRYLKWVHAQEEENTIEIGNRPPVGRFAPSRGRSTPQGRGGGRSGNSKSYGNRQHFGNSSQGGNQKNNRNEKRGRSEFRHKKDSQDDKFHRDRKRDARLEQESIKQVIRAVQILNQQPDLGEYRLPPANSYYRRLQHKQVKEEGLFSSSAGEGQERAVVITRAKVGSGEES